MTDLEQATVLKLVDELKRRFPDGLIVAGLRKTPGDETSDDFCYFNHARSTVAIGMAVRLTQAVKRGIWQETQESDFNDEEKL